MPALDLAKPRLAQPILDRLAIGLSGACALHCLLTPLLLVMLPMLATSFLAQEYFHFAMLGVVVPVSAYALHLGCRQHQDRLVAGLGIAGLLCLTLGATAGQLLFADLGEPSLTLLGAALMAIAHLRNYRLCGRRRCAC